MTLLSWRFVSRKDSNVKINSSLSSLKRQLGALRKKLLCTSSPKYAFIGDYSMNTDELKWLPVEPEYNESHYNAIQHGGRPVNFFAKSQSSIPELGLAIFKNATLVSEHGWVLSESKTLYPEFSWFGGNIDELCKFMHFPRYIKTTNFIKGTTLTLASDYSCKVYGHFAIDSLARLSLFYKAGFNFSDIDNIFCPKPLKGHGEILFKELGIPEDKCIWANGNRALQFETLLCPSFPGLRRNYTPLVPSFFRKALPLDHTKTKRRRLYVTRKGYARNFVNEEKIEDFLHSRGFETYNPAEQAHSHYDFAMAEAVVGISGSALTGLAFCKPDTKVLEILSEDHTYPYYFTLANAGELKFNYLVGTPEVQMSTTYGPSKSDIRVDIEDFKKAIDAMLSN